MQFIGLAANAVCEEERIALQPANLLARILEADSGSGHVEREESVLELLYL